MPAKKSKTAMEMDRELAAARRRQDLRHQQAQLLARVGHALSTVGLLGGSTWKAATAADVNEDSLHALVLEVLKYPRRWYAKGTYEDAPRAAPKQRFPAPTPLELRARFPRKRRHAKARKA